MNRLHGNNMMMNWLRRRALCTSDGAGRAGMQMGNHAACHGVRLYQIIRCPRPRISGAIHQEFAGLGCLQKMRKSWPLQPARPAEPVSAMTASMLVSRAGRLSGYMPT